MNLSKFGLGNTAVAAILGAALMWLLMPRKEVLTPIPVIHTVHDTVKVPLPPIYIHGPKVTSTDTLPPLIISTTFHDTVQVPVNAPDTLRPNWWPMLSITLGEGRGDTAQVATYALRSGKTMLSRVWMPGPLQGAWTDTTGTPRLSFYPQSGYQVKLADKAKYVAIGAGLLKLLQVLGVLK